jgi:hypothetical protein
MTAKDAIRFNLDMSDMILEKYLGDLEDADLMLRPAEGMNHIAWQLGHLISSERMFVEGIKPGASPPLPDGFDAGHSKEAAASNDPKKFLTKDKYLELYRAQRAATKGVLESATDADLSAPSPERIRSFVPTAGAALQMCGSHVTMHVGQFVPIRRKRGKPVVI